MLTASNIVFTKEGFFAFLVNNTEHKEYIKKKFIVNRIRNIGQKNRDSIISPNYSALVCGWVEIEGEFGTPPPLLKSKSS